MFDILKSKSILRKKLTMLAESHYQRGVKSIEYAIIGEVFFMIFLK